MQPSNHHSEHWMRMALHEAEKGWGRTSPNPLVGAVIVKEGKVVGRGYHPEAGQPHAEIFALREAGERARGADMFVTLEPCSTHGRTPPCTQALIEAGIDRVFIGSVDPNPPHAGRATRILEDAGIKVQTGILRSECNRINEAFFHWITTGCPFVLLKMAMTLDGKIATATGQSQWISGPEARQEVQRLRQWADAIMVGGETVRRDNPSLTVREPPDWPCQPQRFVWSRQDSFPKLLNINTGPGGPAGLCRAQTAEEWRDWLAQLGEQHITALLVEGGGELAANLLNAKAVHRVVFFVAPKILGGMDSRPVIGGTNPLSLAEAHHLQDIELRQVGADILISGKPE